LLNVFRIPAIFAHEARYTLASYIKMLLNNA